MFRWMRFGEIISEVGGATTPVDGEVVLGYAVADPVVAHGDGLRATLLDGVGADAVRALIVCDYRGSTLGVAEVRESLS